MSKKTKKSGKVVTVDFTDVETRELLPEGDYHVKVSEIEQEKGEKGPYWNWILKIPSGEYKGKKLYYITSLTKQALFNLRAVLEALGIEVPKKVMKLNPDDYIGLEMGVSVEIEKYRGKKKNVVVDIWNLEDENEEGEDNDDNSDDNNDEDSTEDDQDSGSVDENDEEEYTGTIKSIDDNVITADIDGEEVDIYTDDAEITGEPEEGASITVIGSYDEDEDLIASSLTVKKSKKSSTKKSKKSKK